MGRDSPEHESAHQAQQSAELADYLGGEGCMKTPSSSNYTIHITCLHPHAIHFTHG